MPVYTVDSTILDATDESNERQMVSFWTGTVQNLYIFYVDANADLVFAKSTDGGITWATTVIDGVDDYVGVAVWFDRWTQGDTTGNTIHIVAGNSTDNTIMYFSLGVDDDLAETNNNVVIFTSTLIAAASPSLSICKAKGGNLFVSSSHVTPGGQEYHKSTDSGAGWSSITSPAGGADIGAAMGQSTDTSRLYPLSTDDDIIAVTSDVSQSRLTYWVYDEVADEWETEKTVSGEFTSFTNDSTIFRGYTVCYKKANSDIFIFYMDKAGLIGGIVCRIFDESARTLGAPKTVIPGVTSSVISFDMKETRALCACWHEPTGSIILNYLHGEGTVRMHPCYRISSDETESWSSHRYDFGSNTNDDYKNIVCPAVILNANEGNVWAIFNEDFDDIEANFPVLLKNITGVVKDNAGVAVSGAHVKLFKAGQDVNDNQQNEAFMGANDTDGSGNYAITVAMEGTGYGTYYAVARNTREVEPSYYFDFEYASGKRNDLFYPADTTDISVDTTNNELDFSAGTITAQVFAFNMRNQSDDPPIIGGISWKLRFKLRIDTFTQGGGATRSGLFVYLSTAASNPDVSQGHVGIAFTLTNGAAVITLHGANTGAPSSLPNAVNFTRTTQAETLFVELERTDENNGVCRLYSDATFSTLLESKTIDLSSLAGTELDNICIGVETGDVLNDLIGAIEWMQLWAQSANQTAFPSTATLPSVDVSIQEVGLT